MCRATCMRIRSYIASLCGSSGDWRICPLPFWKTEPRTRSPELLLRPSSAPQEAKKHPPHPDYVSPVSMVTPEPSGAQYEASHQHTDTDTLACWNICTHNNSLFVSKLDFLLIIISCVNSGKTLGGQAPAYVSHYQHCLRVCVCARMCLCSLL